MDEQVLDEVRRLLAPEPDSTITARQRAAALTPPPPEVGGLLRWAVRTMAARAVVEVGAAGGVSAAWILPELPERGVLTSIEPDPHAHALAGDALAALGAAGRVRSILGDPDTVLSRLSDGAYDLVLLQGRPPLDVILTAHAKRLLRPGGLLLVRGALRGGDHAEELARGLAAIADDPDLVAASLPVDGGLLLITRQDAAEEPAGS